MRKESQAQTVDVVGQKLKVVDTIEFHRDRLAVMVMMDIRSE
jgi:hypothetical protein